MIAFLFSPLGKAVGIFLVAAALFGGGYYKGTSDGKLRQMKDTVEALQTRGKIDSNVQKLGDYDLCIELGGLPVDCAELRGMDPAAESQ
jgi:hypothetical protein